LAVGCWLLVTGFWLLAIGCWLLVTGCLLLVAGFWLLAVGWFCLLHPNPAPEELNVYRKKDMKQSPSAIGNRLKSHKKVQSLQLISL